MIILMLCDEIFFAESKYSRQFLINILGRKEIDFLATTLLLTIHSIVKLDVSFNK